MGVNNLTSLYKQKIKASNENLKLKDCVNTVTCSLDNVLIKNAFVTKNPNIAKLKRTPYNGNDYIDTTFFDEYNTSSDIIPRTRKARK